MKILRLPQSDPENFGPQRVRSKQYRELEKKGQLNLFTQNKIHHLRPLSTFNEALMLDERGDTEAAKKMYLKAVRKGEATADAYCNLGLIAFGQEKYPEAINYLTLCLEHNHRHWQAHFNLGNVYADAGNQELSKLHYRIAIKIEPDFPSSYFNLALTLTNTKEFKEAVEMLKQYLAVTPPEEQDQATKLIEKLQRML